LHDGVVTLLEQHPRLLVEAWSCSGDTSLRDASVTVLPNELRLTFARAGVRHIQPDLVLRFDRPGMAPRYGCAEVLATRAPRRPATWLTHAVLLEQAFGERNPVQVVVALGPTMEGWAARQLQGRAGLGHVRVLGPGALASLDRTSVRTDPHRAAFFLAVAREQAAGEACEATIRALVALDDPFSGDYLRMILTALPNPELRKELLMLVRTRVIEIDEADRQGFLYRMAFEDGERAGREEGREEGRVATLIEVLAARGLAPAGSLRERLLACKPKQLDRAVLLALAVTSIDEFERLLFGKPAGLDG
jgi:hypothetical protein